jgi:hypothetical protein
MSGCPGELPLDPTFRPVGVLENSNKILNFQCLGSSLSHRNKIKKNIQWNKMG